MFGKGRDAKKFENLWLKIINAFNQMTKIILLENCESCHIDKFFDVKKFDNKIVKLFKY